MIWVRNDLAFFNICILLIKLNIFNLNILF
jgi:hypothetical protein